MNRNLRLLVLPFLLLAALGWSAAARAADTFEGRVAMLLSTPGDKPMVMNYALKEGRMRVEFGAAEEPVVPDAKKKKKKRGGETRTGVMILDQTKRELLMVMDQERMFMRMPIKDVPGAESEAGGPAEEAKVTATGQTETIAGYAAEQFLLEDKNGTKTELWLAKGLGSWFDPRGAQGPGPFGKRGGRGAATWEAWAKKNGFFPLRVVSLDKAGKEASRMEVQQIEKTALPETLFQPPEGYSEFQMPAGLGGLLGR